MKQSLSALVTSACLSALCIGSAAAQQTSTDGANDKTDSPLSFEVSAGAEYDSNVSVAAIDANTGADDFAAVLDAKIGFETELGDNTEFNLGYNFSQSLHDQFSNFDIQTHFASADISHDFGAFDAGAAYRFAYSRLGGAGFLTLQQFSPYVSTFLAKKLFVRGAYTYSDKDFENRVDRDSTVHAGGADIYFFADGVRRFFVVGYKYEDEDAFDPQFDFQANHFKARFTQRFPVGSRDAKFKLGWRYEMRDYSSLTSTPLGVMRDDDRHRFQAEVEIPITDIVFGNIEYEYSDYSSNLASADYSQNLVSARLGARF
jgi:hypothetical protein